MKLLQGLEDRVEKMISEKPGFKAACDKCFSKADLDGNGKITAKEATGMVDVIFEAIEKDLGDYNVKVTKPTPEQVKEFISLADKDGNYVLDESEFFEFYKQVVKYAAVTSSKGFFKRYGWSMLGGIIATMITKRGVSGVPVAGSVLSPFLNLVPSLLVGPVLGIAVSLGFERGDIMALKKQLFSEKPPQDGAEPSAPPMPS